MESGYWLRLGLIFSIILGSIYVLAPTFLIDESAAIAEKAGQVETNDGSKPDLTVAFEVDGDVQQAAKDLTYRLETMGMAAKQVTADGNTIEVLMKPGVDRAEIVKAAGMRGIATYYDFAAVHATTVDAPPPGEEPPAPDPAEDGEEPAGPDLEALASFTLLSPPAGAVALELPVGSLDLQSGAIPLGEGAPADLGTVLIAVDGGFAGWGHPTDGEQGRYLAYRAFRDNITLEHLLITGELAPMREIVEGGDVLVEEGSGDEVVDEGFKLPPAIEGMLQKDMRLALGIDLSGGIDLTLQVNLEEAVITRVHRDKAGLIADIERDFGGDADAEDLEAADGFLVSCQRAVSAGGGDTEAVDLDVAWKKATIGADRDLPHLTVESELSLADVQTYLARRLQDYEYVETATSEESGLPVHTFRLNDAAQERIGKESIEQVLETLRRRIDATGVKEPSIVKKGGGAISVQLPGMVDLQSAVDAIGTTAVLEFLLVDEELGSHLSSKGLKPMPLENMVDEARKAMPEDQFADDDMLDRWMHDNRYLPEDRMLRWQYSEEEGKEETRSYPPYALKVDLNPLTGSDVNDAGVGWDRAQQPLVTLSFKQRGSNKFCELTSANVNKRFAIMLDDKVMSAPNIRDSICGGRAQIEMGAGLDPQKEAQNLALVLRTGSLNAPVNVGEVRIVGSTLGEDSIRQGAIASAIGSVLVLVFMTIWYRTAGVIANFALGVNVLLVLAILCLFGANLTLPGIAGIALTVGMAVDANIIIYERIREEMSIGQHARKAVDAGFDKAMVAVLDANITTAIAGVVLFSYGTGPIKGFAVTLLIGIMTTLITALFVNRTLMEIVTRSSTARLRI